MPTWLRKITKRKDCLVEITCPQEGFCPNCKLETLKESERHDSQTGQGEEQENDFVLRSNIGLALTCDHSAHPRNECPDDTEVVRQGLLDKVGVIKKKPGTYRLREAYMNGDGSGSPFEPPFSITNNAHSDAGITTTFFNIDWLLVGQAQHTDNEGGEYPERFALPSFEDSIEANDRGEPENNRKDSEGLLKSRNDGARILNALRVDEKDAATNDDSLRSADLIFTPNEADLEEVQSAFPSLTLQSAAPPFNRPSTPIWPNKVNGNKSNNAESFYSAVSTMDALSPVREMPIVVDAKPRENVEEMMNAILRTDEHVEKEDDNRHVREKHVVSVSQHPSTVLTGSKFWLGNLSDPFELVRTEENTTGDRNGTRIPLPSSLSFAQSNDPHERFFTSHTGKAEGKVSAADDTRGSISLHHSTSLVSVDGGVLLEYPFNSASLGSKSQTSESTSGVLGLGHKLSSAVPNTSKSIFDTPGKRPFGDILAVNRPPLRSAYRLPRVSSLDDPFMSPRRRTRRPTHRPYGF